MDRTKAQLTADIHCHRQRLDRTLAMLGNRIERAKQLPRRAGRMTGVVVLGGALVATVALLMRFFVRRFAA
jgi:hypothetical protein